MTAMGVAGSLNLNDLLSAQSIETNSQGSKAEQSELTARGRDGLRGPVKMCVEENASDYGKSVRTTEYGLDGQLLTSRHEMDGKLSYSTSSSDYVQTEVRDSQGRLEKMMWGKRGEPLGETLYTYDDAGRLVTFTNTGMNRLEFHYQPDGSKISVQTFDPKIIEQHERGISAGPEWVAAQAGSGVPMGGNVTMIYDPHDSPTELQVRSADGQLVTQILRAYDAGGRLTEEKLLEKNMPTSFLKLVSAEQRAELTPAQLKAYSKGPYALIKNPLGTTYTYDAQGRITGKRERSVKRSQSSTTKRATRLASAKRSGQTRFFRWDLRTPTPLTQTASPLFQSPLIVLGSLSETICLRTPIPVIPINTTATATGPRESRLATTDSLSPPVVRLPTTKSLALNGTRNRGDTFRADRRTRASRGQNLPHFSRR